LSLKVSCGWRTARVFKPARVERGEDGAAQVAAVVDVRAIRAARVKAPPHRLGVLTRVKAVRTGQVLAASDRIRGLREHF
jgi:hypothetical protein